MKLLEIKTSFSSTNAFFFLFLILLAIACRKEQFGFPLVYTGDVVELTESGVIFYGKVLEQGIGEVINHGFIWGTSQHLAIGKDYSVQLGTMQDLHFKKEVAAGLEEGRTYYLRAFVEKPNQIVYGRMVSFVSLGSKPPIIKNIYPENGVWGDTITIYTENLGFTIEDVKAYVGEHNVPIQEFYQDSLKIIIPNNLTDTIAPISLVLFNNQVFSPRPFIIAMPQILSFTPEGGIKDSTVVISGRAFHPIASNNLVKLGETNLQIISNSGNQLVVKLPEILEHGEFVLSVSTLGRTAISQNSFTYYQPWKRLNNPPFSSPYYSVSFQFENRAFVAAFINYSETRRLWEYDFENDSWINLGNIPLNNFHNSISTQEKGYVFVNRNFYQYNPITNGWSNKASLPIVESLLSEYSNFSIGNRVFLCGGSTANTYHNWIPTNRVFEYNEETNIWTLKQNFPESSIHLANGFSIGEKGYVAFGIRAHNIPNLNIYEYSPDTDSWTVVNTFENVLYHSSNGRRWSKSFVIEDNAYFFGGRPAINPNSGPTIRDTYRFNPINNEVVRLPDLPQTWSPQTSASTFVINGKGYFVAPTYVLWEFDPAKLPPWLK